MILKKDNLSAIKYELPDFLIGMFSHQDYMRWLHRKAAAHAKRDQKRGNDDATVEKYKVAMHRAILDSNGLDAYTGEKLDWHLIGKFNNEEAANRGRELKAELAKLPTVDHVGDGLGPANFKICGWQVNDAKNDMTLDQFIDLCRRIIKYNK